MCEREAKRANLCLLGSNVWKRRKKDKEVEKVAEPERNKGGVFLILHFLLPPKVPGAKVLFSHLHRGTR